MRRILSEKNLVVLLFILVIITFSFAQEDTKRIDKMFEETTSGAASLDQTLHAPRQEAFSAHETNITPGTRLR
ncbi:MAG: hypothetical protein JNK14_09910 [Chitinophagaceae bacterium]|nr:hypothetical protein [Chitinophagaceae bacterium]